MLCSASKRTCATLSVLGYRPILLKTPKRVKLGDVKHTNSIRRTQGCAAASASDGSSNSSSVSKTISLEDSLANAAQLATNLFPLWAVIAGILALINPSLFTWFKMSYVTWGLAFSMMGMGFTMKFADFTSVFTTTPQLLLLGLALQFSVMPLLGYALSRYAGLEAGLAIGMCVLSSCPGGTASNIVAYIAKGEMGLSIMMTMASTLAAIVMTPLLTALLAGTLVPVDPKALFLSTMQVVLLPVVAGAVLNQKFPATIARVSRFSPLAATLVIVLIVGSTLSHSAEAAKRCGLQLVGAVGALHAAGFAIGYSVSKALGLSDKIARTNSIEVGMQNATLGAVLAGLHFADPLVATPCAVSSCTQSIMGSLIAAFWRATVVEKEKPEDKRMA
mmetsp:Transcript_10061/g.21515  ORF Transcript_10061/g.21515 Transcript_10061/m.21515 type:complete len:390 (+) Transcript_10061:220-1389(+)